VLCNKFKRDPKGSLFFMQTCKVFPKGMEATKPSRSLNKKP
jgi:hypothetical protein